MRSDSEQIVLRGGLTVPLVALQVLWDLENRGFTICVDGESLVISPRSQLTTDDSRAIKRHRDQLIALVRHEPEVVS